MSDAGFELTALERSCLKALDAHSVRYLVVGGHAVRAHGYARTTKDLDVLIDNSVENSERFIAAMEQLNIRHPNLVNGEIAGRKRQINFESWGYDFEVLTAADGIVFDTAFAQRSIFDSGDIEVPVISRADLIEMKKRAGRPIDMKDVQELERTV